LLRVTSESLFGKILAGEIRRPASYSIKTIKIMAQLDNRAAALFRLLCSLSISYRFGNIVHDARVVSMGNAGSNSLAPYGLSFDSLNILHEYGLIISDYNSWMDYQSAVAHEAGNWQVSAIVSAQSGSFINVTTGVDNALTGQSNQRPNLVGSAIPANQNVNQWLVGSAFQSPTAGNYGNLGINAFLGPGVLQFDMGLSRLFPIGEHRKLEFRGEAFNVLNRLNANNPTATLNSSTFGRILTASDPRIMQVALKLVF
jgi:hypothetical protein